MRLFDLLAESKIAEWLRNKSKPDYVPPKSIEKTLIGKSYESCLLEDIKELISKAYSQDTDVKKKELLSQAKDLEIQLMISYEKQGFNLIARSTEELIKEYKSKVSSKASQKPLF